MKKKNEWLSLLNANKLWVLDFSFNLFAEVPLKCYVDSRKMIILWQKCIPTYNTFLAVFTLYLNVINTKIQLNE